MTLVVYQITFYLLKEERENIANEYANFSKGTQYCEDSINKINYFIYQQFGF